MKLNWFSPLAPARSEIAYYTAGTVAALRSYAEVTLWTDQPKWDSRLEQITVVRRFELERLPWTDLHWADLSIFQIGNHSVHHGGIWELSRQLPGIVVLHELQLHDLFHRWFCKQHRIERYLGSMETYYGDAGRIAGEAFCRGEPGLGEHMAENYPLTGMAVESAAGVVVHTPESFERVAALATCPVTQLCPRSPDGYARALVEFADVARRFRLRRLAAGLVERVGTELSAWSNLKARWNLYRNTAEQIRRIAG